jgi:hypothetical protein
MLLEAYAMEMMRSREIERITVHPMLDVPARSAYHVPGLALVRRALGDSVIRLGCRIGRIDGYPCSGSAVSA